MKKNRGLARKSFARNFGGFTLVEGLLILVLIGILAGTGWYVYQAHNKTADQLANADSANSSVTKYSKKSSSSSSSTANQSIIKITDLGIQITAPDAIKDLTFSIRTSQTDSGSKLTIADVSTQKLTSLDSECAASKEKALGAFGKASGTYPSQPSNTSGTLVKQFPTFYITFDVPQAYCSQNATATQLTKSQQTDLKATLSTVKEL